MHDLEFDIRPVTVRTGAEIVGLDLSQDLDDVTISKVREALVRHKVVFFRGQDIDEGRLATFAGRFGELSPHPMHGGLEGHPNVLDLDYNRVPVPTEWHTDLTFMQCPPLGSMLRAVVVPPYGGDTMFANTATAYQDLPDDLRELADRMWAIHSNQVDALTQTKRPVATALNPEEVDEYGKRFFSRTLTAMHPVVRVHPESGERALLLGHQARRLRGLTATESVDLMRIFQSHVTRPENTMRWRWEPGDIVFWDNRAAQHCAVDDYGDLPRRRVQRVTVAGDVPVGVHGQRSELLSDVSM